MFYLVQLESRIQAVGRFLLAVFSSFRKFAVVVDVDVLRYFLLSPTHWAL